MNITLFVIARRRIWMVTFSGVLVFVWWHCADFFVVQRLPAWPEQMESVIVAVLSTCFVTWLVLYTRSEIREGLRAFVADAPTFPLPVDLKIRRSMLTVVSESCEGTARHYVTWLRDCGAGWMPWISASWFFALLLFLAVPPLHSGVMETLSRNMSVVPGSLVGVQPETLRAAAEIFNVRNTVTKMVTVESTAVEQTSEYRLNPMRGGWVRTAEAIIDAVGGASTKLHCYAGDYPHVHRVIDIECAPPGCVLPGMRSQDRLKLPLRAHHAAFEYQQPRSAYPVQGAARLNVRARLKTAWGLELSRAFIERN